MRDQINRNNVIAEENLNLTGHPAKEKLNNMRSYLTNEEDMLEEDKHKDTPKERKRKIKQMEEVIKEDIERAKE